MLLIYRHEIRVINKNNYIHCYIKQRTQVRTNMFGIFYRSRWHLISKVLIMNVTFKFRTSHFRQGEILVPFQLYPKIKQFHFCCDYFFSPAEVSQLTRKLNKIKELAFCWSLFLKKPLIIRRITSVVHKLIARIFRHIFIVSSSLSS